MTRLLEQAFEAASELPSGDQDALATQLLEEIAWERQWDSAFEGNPAKLKRLASEAREEMRSGKTRPLNFED